LIADTVTVCVSFADRLHNLDYTGVGGNALSPPGYSFLSATIGSTVVADLLRTLSSGGPESAARMAAGLASKGFIVVIAYDRPIPRGSHRHSRMGQRRRRSGS
jgi:hypothetical protein